MMLVTMAAGRDEGLGWRAGSILSWLSVAAAIYGGLYLEPGVSGGGGGCLGRGGGPRLYCWGSPPYPYTSPRHGYTRQAQLA